METLVYSAEEAAKAIKTTKDVVLKRVEKGEIPAYREGRNWKIPKKLLQEYIIAKALEETKDRQHIEREVYGNVDVEM